MMNIDLYDKKILYELDINSRATLTELSSRIKLPKETIKYRISRLSENNIIKDFFTLVNASKLGYLYYKVFIKFYKLTAKEEEKMIKYICSESKCSNLRIIEGIFDISFLTMQKNPYQLKRFLTDFNNSFGGFIINKSIQTILKSHKLNQKALFAGKTSPKSFYYGHPENTMLSDIQKKIVNIISSDSRIKLVDIARKVNSNPKTIKKNLKNLEEEGIISGYSVIINNDILKLEFIEIDISLKSQDSIPAIIEFFDKTNACVFVHEVLGRYDLSIEMFVSDDNHLRKIITMFKERFLKDYISYDISHIFKEYIINWSPFEPASYEVINFRVASNG
jgi:DNA-binding Lrp family transcriptional regulator